MNGKKLKKTQNIVKKALIGNLIFLSLIAIIFFVMYSINAKRVKLIIDKKEIKNGSNVFVNKKGKTYVDLTTLFSALNSYKINNGVYGKTTENKDSFYIETPYEAVQFVSNTKNMTKTIKLDYQDRMVDAKTGNIEMTEDEKKEGKEKPVPREKTPIDDAIISKEEFKLNEPVLKENGKVYAFIDDLKYIINAKIDAEGPNKRITTVPELEKNIASYLSANNLSLSSLYQNRKAIVDDYFVASSSSGLSGVYKISKDGNIYENIIGPQYEEIRFIQSEKNMYFTTTDKKLGLKSLENLKDIIKAGDYEAISIYYKDEGLYLAKKNDKFGVINNNGKIIIPLEYDQIGLEENEEKKLEAAKNDDEKEEKKIDKESKIIMDKFIPLMQKTSARGEMWRLAVKDGTAFTDLNLVGIGYKSPKLVVANERGMIEIPEEKKELAEKLNIKTSTIAVDNTADLKKLGLTLNKHNVIDRAEDLLYIPEGYSYSGVVVEVSDPSDKINTTKYGIIREDFSANTIGDPFIYPPVAERIYKIGGEGGEIKYLAENMNTQDEFLKGKREDEAKITRRIQREDAKYINPEEEKKKALERSKKMLEDNKEQNPEENQNNDTKDEQNEQEKIEE